MRWLVPYISVASSKGNQWHTHSVRLHLMVGDCMHVMDVRRIELACTSEHVIWGAETSKPVQPCLQQQPMHASSTLVTECKLLFPQEALTLQPSDQIGSNAHGLPVWLQQLAVPP